MSTQSWICSLCGYVHHGPKPPEYCPICGAGSADFSPYEDAATPSGKTSSGRWHCLECSYIHEGINPPDSCPICGAGSDCFEADPEVSAPEQSPSGEITAVIAGGGIAGVSAAETIRKASPGSSVTIVCQEKLPPYYRLNLTRYLAGEIDAASLPIHPEQWYLDNNIDLLTGARVIDIRDGKCIIDNGQELKYDKLILAIGSHPFVPPLSGTDLDGVYTLRTAQDADTIIIRLEAKPKCVCIGGGILGLETAGALAQRGADITLLETHQWLMPRQLTQKAAAFLEKHAAAKGIKIRKNARTAELKGESGTITQVLLDDGEALECGMALICTGVRPNTHLARKAGLEVNTGIVVNNHLFTSDSDILAAGDIAEHNGIVYGVWGPSQFQGSIAALNALGIDTPFGGLPRSNALKVLGIDMLSIGEFTPVDGSYLVIDEETQDAYRHFVFHDGKLVGCILLGDIGAAGSVKDAIENRKDFSKCLAGSPECGDILSCL